MTPSPLASPVTRTRSLLGSSGPASLVAPVACGVASLWRLFEMDLFWALRAGAEIVRTRSISLTEQWSYTVPGAPWAHTHWLTEVTLFGVHRLFGFGGLVVFRGTLVAAWVALVQAAFARAWPSARGRAAAACVAALAYVAGTHRMELRGEVFVLLGFASVVWAWAGKPVARRHELGLGAALVASNFHAGQGLMVAALAAALAAFDATLPLARRAAWALACAAATWCTPVGWGGWSFALRHLRYASELENPDHRPLSAALFDVQRSGHGLAYVVFVVLAAVAALGVLAGRRTRAGGFYPVRWASLGALAGAVWLSVDRVRAVPFAVTLAVPWIAVGLRAPGAKASRRAVSVVATLVAVATVGAHVPLVPRRWGFDVDDRVFPVHAAAYVARERPLPNLHHTFTFGAYLVFALPDYRLFGDTREEPFRSVSGLYKMAYGSARVSQELYRRFDIRSMMMPIPGTERVANIGWRDVLEEYTPRSEWALVYFDDLALVQVRRLPEHERLIAGREFTLLRPNLPFVYATAKGRTKERDRLARDEIARCLALNPTTKYCLAARAALEAEPLR